MKIFIIDNVVLIKLLVDIICEASIIHLEKASSLLKPLLQIYILYFHSLIY